jgi:hypothetical protein
MKTSARIFFTIAMMISSLSYCQTKLYFIGGIHNGNLGYNSDTIYGILEQIRPDAILYEYDSIFFNADFTFNTVMWPGTLKSVEAIASTKYQTEYGGKIRPFDIEGRNKFYFENEYGTKEPEMIGKIDSLYTYNLLDEKGRKDVELFFTTLSLTSLRGYSLEDVNSEMFRKMCELKHFIIWDLNIEIVKSSSELKEFVEFAEIRRDFWIKRNNAMVEHILFWCNEFKGQKIVVFTGSEHLYFLHNIIQEVAKENNIEIIEYWK